jgi:cardiolipin synthase
MSATESVTAQSPSSRGLTPARFPAFAGNDSEQLQETIFFDGSDYFQGLLHDIENAKSNIDLEMYIFVQDLVGDKFINALLKAVQRGVAVRVLVDGIGSPDWGGEKVEQLEKAGAKTRIFKPLPWRFWQWSRSKIRKPIIQKAIYLLSHMNSRNHRKVAIIDNKIVYTGSFNFSKNHLTKEQNGDDWRDTGIRLQNIDITPLQDAFAAVWAHQPIRKWIKAAFKRVDVNAIVRLNNTRHKRRVLYKDLLRRITHCKRRIWITNAYFLPNNFLLKRLAKAARKKVDVRILLPRKMDIPFLPWAVNLFYKNLLKSGVKIFEYLPSMLHAKSLILDDWMMIGSSNFDHRSLLHNLEVDINVQLANSKRLLEQQFLHDLKSCKKITLADWQKRPLYQRIIGRLYLYLKYWV